MICLLCATLGWESMETYLKLWTLPATWQKAGSLPELFSSKKVKSYKEAKKFKCSASETLSLCPLLAFLAAHVFVPKGSHVLECQAFLSMNRVLELLQASDRVAPPVLQMQVEFALRTTKEAGWSNYMTRKFHWLLHLATSLQLHAGHWKESTKYAPDMPLPPQICLSMSKASWRRSLRMICTH